MADFYDVLGVERNASSDQIKRAYRKLARELHPDVNPDPVAQNRFKEVTEAYEVLSDPNKRSNFDRGGQGFNFGAGGAGAGFGFGDIMDAFFGGGGSRGPRPRVQRGQDALIRIEIDLMEATFGSDREITVETALVCTKCTGSGSSGSTQPTKCSICQGRGEVQQVTRSVLGQVMSSRPCANCQGFGSVITDPCRECAGDGRVRSRRTLNVQIPAGVETGNRIQMSGQGEVGPGGGPAGDLYVEIVEKAHEYLVRSGDDLHMALTIPMTSAVLGTTVSIETLDGESKVDIKAGTQSGTVIPIKNRGVTKLRSSHRGELFVHVEVVIPTKLNKAEEELVRNFAKLRGDSAESAKVDNRENGLFGRLKDALGR